MQNTSHPKTNLHTSFCPQLLRSLQKQMSCDYTHRRSQGRPLFICTDIILHSSVSNGKGENMSQRFLFRPNAVKLFRSLLKYEARFKQKKIFKFLNREHLKVSIWMEYIIPAWLLAVQRSGFQLRLNTKLKHRHSKTKWQK